jgi:hypothetical protein
VRHDLDFDSCSSEERRGEESEDAGEAAVARYHLVQAFFFSSRLKTCRYLYVS